MLFQLLNINPLLILPWLLAVILAIGWHEFAHALAAYWQGDDTAQASGRLTMNPLAHIDWLGLVLLVFIGFGWGKPTPFNPYNLKYKKWGSALVSVAGPLSNLIMVVIALTAYKILGFYDIINWLQAGNLLEIFLMFVVQLNVMLFVFNLIPVPPLDGSKILYTFLGAKHQATILKLEFYGPWILLGILLVGEKALSAIIAHILVLLYTLFGLI
ncbi:MAG: site-2 protease family protein [Patescibacteria group bacterium]|jgi:Zn-dependent protease